MYIKDTEAIILNMNHVIDNYIYNENDSADKLKTLFDFLLKNFPLLNEQNGLVINPDHKNLIFRRYNWFYSKILLITINDDANK